MVNKLIFNITINIKNLQAMFLWAPNLCIKGNLI